MKWRQHKRTAIAHRFATLNRARSVCGLVLQGDCAAMPMFRVYVVCLLCARGQAR